MNQNPNLVDPYIARDTFGIWITHNSIYLTADERVKAIKWMRRVFKGYC